MPEIIALPLMVALTGSLIFSFIFLWRIGGAIFSSKLRGKISGKPFLHFLMFFAIPTSAALVVLLHPPWVKRYEERKIVLERVKQAGGWDAIKRDSVVLANQQINVPEYVWFGFRTNSPPLPPAIAALKPYEVRCYSDASIPIVRIHVVGLMSTDNAWPRYWLWVVCGETAKDFMPKIQSPTMWHHETIRKIADSIFEKIDY